VATTDRSVTALYHELNQRYFRGRLPQYWVVFAQPKVTGWHGECFPARRLIQLRRGLTGDELRQTLLHEMCHIGSPGHGRRFQAKLARLVEQGEPWAQAEIDGYRNSPLSWPNMLRELRASLDEWAYRQPRPNFAAIQRYAADAMTCRPSEILRKVPWLGAAWRHACVRVDRQRALRN
jgi:hypothetical protein